ncbi:hypothetical protein TNCV_3667831 [Trichonephila clavipes]|nr:hypothetical protein TNCV_3667831 [Trichonephila clavipes]
MYRNVKCPSDPPASTSKTELHPKFVIEIVNLPHPSYSPDLPSTDYHLFRALNNSFSQKTFDDLDAVEIAIQDFLTRNRQNFTAVGFISYQKDVEDFRQAAEKTREESWSRYDLMVN